MGRRRKQSAAEGSSAMDIMTALIGCLILILLGILVIVLVSQVMVVLASPDEKQVRSIVTSKVDGFRESQAFPEGNVSKEPLYVDVHRNYLYIFGYDRRFDARDIWQPENDYDTIVKTVAKRAEKEYILFLLRPGSDRLYDQLLRKLEIHNIKVPANEKIEYGMELYESGRDIDAGMTTREQEDLRFYDLDEFRATQNGEPPVAGEEEGAAEPADEEPSGEPVAAVSDSAEQEN